MSARIRLVANVVLFQAGWFACVLGAAHGQPWLGPAACAAILAWHLRSAGRALPEFGLIVLSAALGFLFDSLLARFDWLRFPGDAGVRDFSPWWMVSLWAIFATTLNVSLRWLRPKTALSVLLGGIGGPLAYYSGSRLGALELSPTGTALMAVAIGWALLTPLLFEASRRLDGFRPQ